MGKLDNLRASKIDDGNKARACGQYRFLCISLPPLWIKCRDSCFIEANCNDLGEFFDTKRVDGDAKALEKTLGVFSFLLIYVQQHATICIIQILRQVVQKALDTLRKTATQSGNLTSDILKPMRMCKHFSKCLIRDEGGSN